MSHKILCSVSVLTYNSQEHLAECLASITDFAEVCVVDGGSTDATLTIARQYGAKIFSQFDNPQDAGRIKNFGAMRERSMAFNTLDWILVLDSDEFLSPEAVREIREALRQYQTTPWVAFSLEYKTIVEGQKIEYAFHIPRYIRLFNKHSGIMWKKDKPVHEKLFVPKEIKVIALQHPFWGYVPSAKACRKKDAYYLSLAWSRMQQGVERGKRLEVLRAAGKNLLRAVWIALKSVVVYLRYGFQKSLPPHHVWRYVRYHLVISYFRIKQFFFPTIL